MTCNELDQIIAEVTKGAQLKVNWKRTCKVKKTCQNLIEKETIALGRIGIDYDNQKVVREKRENGELPEESQPIWHGKGEWVKFPFLIRHTVTDQLYLRLYKGINDKQVPHVKFYIDGKETSKDDISSMLLASEKTEKDGDCFCCKLEDVKSIIWYKKSVDIEQEKTEPETETETETV